MTCTTFQSFRLLENRSLKIPGVRDFSWSPTDNILAYWVAEDKDVPARVTLLEIPRYDKYNFLSADVVSNAKVS